MTFCIAVNFTSGGAEGNDVNTSAFQAAAAPRAVPTSGLSMAFVYMVLATGHNCSNGKSRGPMNGINYDTLVSGSGATYRATCRPFAMRNIEAIDRWASVPSQEMAQMTSDQNPAERSAGSRRGQDCSLFCPGQRTFGMAVVTLACGLRPVKSPQL